MSKEIFLEIAWSKDDIRQLLRQNNQDDSDEAIDKFIANIDLRYMEETCIETGWEIMQSKIKENI